MKVGANRTGPRPGPFPNPQTAGLGREAAKIDEFRVAPRKKSKTRVIALELLDGCSAPLGRFGQLGAALVASHQKVDPCIEGPRALATFTLA